MDFIAPGSDKPYLFRELKVTLIQDRNKTVFVYDIYAKQISHTHTATLIKTIIYIKNTSYKRPSEECVLFLAHIKTNIKAALLSC